MGLATPAAIAVGLGRAARNGVLFRNGRSLEVFKNIKQVVFDKTGTLTIRKFTITSFSIADNQCKVFRRKQKCVCFFHAHAKHKPSIKNHQSKFPRSSQPAAPQLTNSNALLSLEKYSSHPIGRTIAKEWKTKGDIRWAKIEEIKGLGMKATDKDGI